MGTVRMGPPHDLVLYLKKAVNSSVFFETGTFHGHTSAWAAGHFREVKTIEFSEAIYRQTAKKFAHKTNITFLFGDARQQLAYLLASVQEPALFWLDAHWCSFGSYGEHGQCPLLEELDLILTSPFDHVVLIDDARLFLSPPPAPNLPSHYPDIYAILHKLSLARRHTVVYEDVIIAVPQAIKAAFLTHLHGLITAEQQRQSTRYRRRLRVQKAKDFTKALLWPLRFLWSKS